jgi:hypothetical protein
MNFIDPIAALFLAVQLVGIFRERWSDTRIALNVHFKRGTLSEPTIGAFRVR